MAKLLRYKVHLTYTGGGPPGLSVIHSNANEGDPGGDTSWAQNFATLLKNAYTAAAPYLITGLVMTVDAEVIPFDPATGIMNANPIVISPPAPANGSALSTNMPRYVQANCKHETDGISSRGHRINGRTFVGPLGNVAIDNNGALTPAAQTALSGMWDGMQDVAAARLVVWHRPAKAYTKPDGTPVPASVGSYGHVQKSICKATPAVLRSRRD